MEAVILAGGQGTRLREKVPDTPKSMVTVAGRPFLEYLLDYLEYYKFSRVILSVGFLKEQIIDYFNDSYKGMEISYALEDEPLGTGGGIRLAMKEVSEDHAFIINGDTFFRVNLRAMHEQFVLRQHKACLALRRMEDTGRYGTVEFDNNLNIKHFKEKQTSSSEGYINGGIYLLDKDFLMSYSFPQNFSIEKDFFEKEVSKGMLFAFPSEDYFIDIGIPEDYERAQKEFAGLGQK